MQADERGWRSALVSSILATWHCVAASPETSRDSDYLRHCARSVVLATLPLATVIAVDYMQPPEQLRVTLGPATEVMALETFRTALLKRQCVRRGRR
jgi:hypothetical protein